MKTLPLLFAALLATLITHADPLTVGNPPTLPSGNLTIGNPPVAPVAQAKEPANYLIHVEWKQTSGDTKSLEVLTGEGTFQFDGVQKNSAKINNSEIPSTLKLSGSLTAFTEEKGRLQLFLGRTVPYVTSSYGSGSNTTSSYSQMSVGLSSTFLVRFGKSAVIQTDENGEISVVVKRLKE